MAKEWIFVSYGECGFINFDFQVKCIWSFILSKFTVCSTAGRPFSLESYLSAGIAVKDIVKEKLRAILNQFINQSKWESCSRLIISRWCFAGLSINDGYEKLRYYRVAGFRFLNSQQYIYSNY